LTYGNYQKKCDMIIKKLLSILKINLNFAQARNLYK
jgi:hypothetical protein